MRNGSHLRAIGFAVLLSIGGFGPARACGGATGTLTFYTTQLEKDAKALANGFKSACPGVDINWVRSSTSRILDMIATELTAGEVKADVLMVSDALHLLPLKLDQQLTPLPQIDVSGLVPGSYDLDRTYFGTKLITTVIVGSGEGREIVMPKSWSEFEAAAKDQRASLPDPDRSILAGNHLAGILAQDTLGWRHLEVLAQSGVELTGGIGASMSGVMDGSSAFGVGVDFLAVNARKAGADISISFPEDGSIAMTEPLAVMARAKNPEAAAAFVDYVLKPDAQNMIRAHGFVPVLETVPSPEGFPDRETLNIVIPDEGVSLREARSIQERFREIFGQSPTN